jgi:glutaredoxin 3
MTATVEIYTTPTCGYCRAAKALLTRKNVAFQEINVAGDAELRAAMVSRAHGRTTVPQIFINDSHVGGCDDLYALEQLGALDKLLAGEKVPS